MLNAKDLLNPKKLAFTTRPRENVVKIKDKRSPKKHFSQSDYDRMQRQRNEGYELIEIADMNDCHKDTVMRNTTAKKVPESTPLWYLPQMVRDGQNHEQLISYNGEIIGKFTPVEDFKDDNDK